MNICNIFSSVLHF